MTRYVHWKFGNYSGPVGYCPHCHIEELKSERNDYKTRTLSYEAANTEQGKLLNEVIAQRDELLAAFLEKLIEVADTHHCQEQNHNENPTPSFNLLYSYNYYKSYWRMCNN